MKYILFLIFTLLLNVVQAGGGENIFFLHTDLWAMALSMTGLVLLTVFFELFFHHCKHSFYDDDAKLEVFHKVQGELTVLGFISIVTILIAQFGQSNTFVAENLQEFEISHLWLFFIGMMFVGEAFLMMHYAEDSVNQLTDHDRVPADLVISHLEKKHSLAGSCKSKTYRFCYCRCPFGCLKTRNHDAATHKLYRVFFKHFYRAQIQKKLGKYALKFDFAQYLIAFWRNEVAGLQEIAISTWTFFLICFWGVVFTRRWMGDLIWNDTAYTTTAIFLNWVCFFSMLILVLEGFESRRCLNSFLSSLVTGNKNASVLDALQHLRLISHEKSTWDDDGYNWNAEDHEIEYEKSLNKSKLSIFKLRQNSILSLASKERNSMMDDDTDEDEEAAKEVTEVQNIDLFEETNKSSDRTTIKKEIENVSSSTGSSNRRRNNGDVEMTGLNIMTNDTLIKDPHNTRDSTVVFNNSTPQHLHPVASQLEEHKSLRTKAYGKRFKSMATMKDGTIKSCNELREETRKRLHDVQQRDLRKISHCSNRLRQVIFSALLFFHSFLYGWFLFVNLREITNVTKYYGMVPTQVGYNGSSSTASSTSKSSSSSSRMLLESASSSTSSAATGPSSTIPGWHTCQEFRDAGAPLSEKAGNSIMFAFSFSTPVTIRNGEQHGFHDGYITCSIHWSVTSPMFVIVMTIVPLLTTTFLLIPTYLRLYAYQKALIGEDGGCFQQGYMQEFCEDRCYASCRKMCCCKSSDHDRSNIGHRRSLEYHEGNTSPSMHGLDVEEDFDHYEIAKGGHHGHHDHDHTGGLGGHNGDDHEHHEECCSKTCLSNLFFGKDLTTFNQLICAVADNNTKEERIRKNTRIDVLRALKREIDTREYDKYAVLDNYGMLELLKFIGREEKARKNGGSLVHSTVSNARMSANLRTPRTNTRRTKPTRLSDLPEERDDEKKEQELSDLPVVHHSDKSDNRSGKESDSWVTEDHNPIWDEDIGHLMIRKYAENFFEFMRTKGCLLTEKKSKIKSTGCCHCCQSKSKKAKQIELKLALNKEVGPSQLLWGINTLYKYKLHVGVMTEDDAKTLVRALDINGDAHLTKEEWMGFLFPKTEAHLTDEEVNFKNTKIKLDTAKKDIKTYQNREQELLKELAEVSTEYNCEG
jgi:hypothetical protein